MPVELYHPTLKTTITVSEKSVHVHEGNGWTREVPKKSDEPSSTTRAPRPGRSEEE